MAEEKERPTSSFATLSELVIMAIAICIPLFLDKTSKSPGFKSANNQDCGGESNRGGHERSPPTLVGRSSQSHPDNQAKNNSDNSDEAEQHWPRLHSQRMVRFNGWLVGATVALVILGCLQFWETYVTQRGFLHLESLSLKSLSAGQIPVVTAGIKNSGRTTAFVEDGNVSWKFLSRSLKLPETPEYFKGDVQDSLTGPFVPDENVGVDWNAILDVNFATQKLIDDIKSGEVLIFVYGYVTYRDTFKLFSHTTNFCGVYDGKNLLPGNQFARCKNKKYESAD